MYSMASTFIHNFGSKPEDWEAWFSTDDFPTDMARYTSYNSVKWKNLFIYNPFYGSFIYPIYIRNVSIGISGSTFF